MSNNCDKWNHINECLPKKQTYYRCLCKGFSKPIKCKFKKAVKTTFEWRPEMFIYKKRIPFVEYWREIK